MQTHKPPRPLKFHRVLCKSLSIFWEKTARNWKDERPEPHQLKWSEVMVQVSLKTRASARCSTWTPSGVQVVQSHAEHQRMIDKNQTVTPITNKNNKHGQQLAGEWCWKKRFMNLCRWGILRFPVQRLKTHSTIYWIYWSLYRQIWMTWLMLATSGRWGESAAIINAWYLDFGMHPFDALLRCSPNSGGHSNWSPCDQALKRARNQINQQQPGTRSAKLAHCNWWSVAIPSVQK